MGEEIFSYIDDTFGLHEHLRKLLIKTRIYMVAPSKEELNPKMREYESLFELQQLHFNLPQNSSYSSIILKEKYGYF